MAYNFTQFKTRAGEIEEWIKAEFATLRTGRATPSILDHITVESYGSRIAIAHVSAITIEDARTLRISPWDKSQTKSIESAIVKADLGLGVSTDDVGLRVSFPQLTTERRAGILRVAKEKLEEARVSLRKERESLLADLKQSKSNGEISEDEVFKTKDDLQKLVDEANAKYDALFAKKEIELAG